MARLTTSSVYISVIQDVINNVREEFINNGGPGESVLKKLQELWEMKMMEAGGIIGPIERNSAPRPTFGGPTPVHDLNVPYEGTEEYETPTAELLFPPTPMQTPLPGMSQTPLPGTAQTPLDSSLYNIFTNGTPMNEYSTVNDANTVKETKRGPFLSQPWLNERAALDVNVAYVEGREDGQRGGPHQPLTQDLFMMSAGKRKRDDFPSQYNSGGYVPQQDGAGDLMVSDELKVVEGLKIPQLDGSNHDPYDDILSTPNIYYNNNNNQGVVNEDYNSVTPQAPNATPIQNDVVEDDDDDEPLNENDDDDDDYDDVDHGEDHNTMQHLVLAQFDKVTRTKSRWKCTLKDGIMQINNKDVLFNKATGEFEF